MSVSKVVEVEKTFQEEAAESAKGLWQEGYSK